MFAFLPIVGIIGMYYAVLYTGQAPYQLSHIPNPPQKFYKS